MVHLASLIILPISLIKWNPSFKYFVNMFKEQTIEYILKITPFSVPKKNNHCRNILSMSKRFRMGRWVVAEIKL
uniref:Uncharacterized protein n=1 Tax=viral metagenome TaxID=1070528 RepID=A0A6C0J901_9ZZZZ